MGCDSCGSKWNVWYDKESGRILDLELIKPSTSGKGEELLKERVALSDWKSFDLYLKKRDKLRSYAEEFEKETSIKMPKTIVKDENFDNMIMDDTKIIGLYDGKICQKEFFSNYEEILIEDLKLYVTDEKLYVYGHPNLTYYAQAYYLKSILDYLQRNFGEAHLFANKNKPMPILLRAKKIQLTYEGPAFLVAPLLSQVPLKEVETEKEKIMLFGGFISLSAEERKALANAVCDVAGIGGGEDVFWAIFDPYYGALKKTSLASGKIELAKATIDSLARKNFPEVKSIILRISQLPDPRLKNLSALLPRMTSVCRKCNKEIYSMLDVCPYCKSKVGKGEIIEEKEDPLTILKLRYAKGEITREEYEEMKKTLESE